jgi:integrase/recombinase XerC
MPLSEDPSVQRFIDYLCFEKRFSPLTAKAYGDDLQQFGHFLEETYGELRLLQVSSLQIRSWMASMSEQQLKARSINRKLSCLKSFYRFCRKVGLTTQNPAAGIKVLKIPKRLPVYVEEAGMQTLQKQDVYPPGIEGMGDRLLINLLYQTGIRVSELVNLSVQQLDLGKPVLKVLGKGNKERIIPLQQTTADDIREFLKEKADSESWVSSRYLFQKPDGGPIAARKAYGIVRKYLSLVTTQEKKSPHVLRHSFATHLTQHGADLNAVKELLGHASLAATQVYTHHSLDKIRDIHRKSHPKG